MTTKRATKKQTRKPGLHDLTAFALAREAHEKNHASRRGGGAFQYQDRPVGFYVYDNNPWACDEGLAIRDGMYAEVAAQLELRGCRLVGSAHYPEQGEGADYTLGQIYVSASPESVAADQEFFWHQIRVLIRRHVERDRHRNDPPPPPPRQVGRFVLFTGGKAS